MIGKNHPFLTLDVFSDQPFGGNPLAVFPEGDSVPAEWMQAIAQEFNLSETVFIMSGTDGADADIRIFTPQTELPFAGHPTVGAAFALHWAGALSEGGRLRVTAGLIETRIEGEVVTITAPELARRVDGPLPTREEISGAVGLEVDDIVVSDRSPAICSSGTPLFFVEVSGKDALQRARPGDIPAEPGGGALVALDDLSNGIVHMRVFAPRFGILEDPATGGAAAALPAFLQLLGHDVRQFTIHQGDFMGRPSRIEVGVFAADGQGLRTAISGRAVKMTEGQLILPV